MKGLLIKDFKLMKMQGKFFLFIVAMAVGIGFLTEQTSFITGYLAFVVPLFALNTLSYDEFENGCAYLFTLPVTREGYAAEKYLFALLLQGGSLLLAVVLTLLLGAVKGVSVAGDLLAAPLTAAIMLGMLSVMLPLQLKFGAEKGRVVLIAVMGGGVALAFGAAKLLAALGVDFGALPVPGPWMIAAVIAGALLVLLVSLRVSIAIIRKKEY